MNLTQIWYDQFNSQAFKVKDSYTDNMCFNLKLLLITFAKPNLRQKCILTLILFKIIF